MILDYQNFPQLYRGTKPLMGLDIGIKNIGVGLSDRTWFIANSLITIARTKFLHDVRKLCELIKLYNVSGLVVGWPLNMDGSIGPRCQSIRDFCQLFKQYCDLPILLFDERLSTVMVNNLMLTADLSRRRRAELVDKLAAAYILQGALDCLSKYASLYKS